jgi:hypothetical protein
MYYERFFDESGLLCRVDEETLTDTCKNLACKLPLSTWTPKCIA